MIIELRDLPTQSDSSSIDEQIYFTDGETGQAFDFSDFYTSLVIYDLGNDQQSNCQVFSGNETNGQIAWPAGKDGGYLQLLIGPSELDVPRTARYRYVFTFYDSVSGETHEAITHGIIKKVVP